MTEKELLSIVATLKEFRNILLGQQLIVHTDHKNLTCKNFNTERVMRWRLVLEEFGPELHYIKGENNIVADALSRLDMDNQQEIFNITEAIGYDDDDLPPGAFPIQYSLIGKEQQKDSNLQAKLTFHKKRKNNPYTYNIFRGGEKDHKLLCKNSKIVIPQVLQERIVHWYHNTLCHPGHTRTEESIRQNFEWKGMRPMIRRICKTCPACQKAKKQNTKYGKLPAKTAEEHPWDTLCVDLIGPYKIKRKNKKI